MSTTLTIDTLRNRTAAFAKKFAGCQLDESSRNMLIECAKLDWSEISPAIFGSLFQPSCTLMMKPPKPKNAVSLAHIWLR